MCVRVCTCTCTCVYVCVCVGSTCVVDEDVDGAALLPDDLHHVEDLGLLRDVAADRDELARTRTRVRVRLEPELVPPAANHVHACR